MQHDVFGYGFGKYIAVNETFEEYCIGLFPLFAVSGNGFAIPETCFQVCNFVNENYKCRIWGQIVVDCYQMFAVATLAIVSESSFARMYRFDCQILISCNQIVAFLFCLRR